MSTNLYEDYTLFRGDYRAHSYAVGQAVVKCTQECPIVVALLAAIKFLKYVP